MSVIFYFAFGLLNIGLLFLLTNIYRRKTGMDLFPGRIYDDKLEMILYIISYVICGPFGTAILCIIGLILFWIWIKNYKNK